MKLHPRYAIVRKAELKISEAVGAASEEFELTPNEVVAVLAEELSRYVKYPLRMERHGNYDKKADEE